jgi:demethylmenaquinone methyltransferase / 2-methoxy-6-polyprenyl-1,4-benzoquinol methylase
MFNRVPQSYDLVNRIITCGLDRRWRKAAVLRCIKNGPGTVLDLGCGTGDLAVRLAETSDRQPQIIGLDFSRPMLRAAVKKAGRRRIQSRITWIQSDVRELPFADNRLDCAGISFAFRNLTYKNPFRDVFLREICRVIKPGGRFVIVESSQPDNPWIHLFFRWYVRIFVRIAGRLVSRDKGAYRYLADSVIRFYKPNEITVLLKQAGFREVGCRPLFLGAAALHEAVK